MTDPNGPTMGAATDGSLSHCDNLAFNLLKAGRVADSRAEFGLLLAHSERIYKDTNPHAQYLSNAAKADNFAGDFASAEQKLATAIPMWLKELPADSPIVIRAQKRFAAAKSKIAEMN